MFADARSSTNVVEKKIASQNEQRSERDFTAQVSPPKVTKNGPLQLLITNLDYDEHKGRIAIGKVTSGSITRAETILIGRPGVHPAHSHSLLLVAHTVVFVTPIHFMLLDWDCGVV